MIAGSHRGDRRSICFEHELVQSALCFREFAVDRKSARDVGGIALVFAAGVDQQQLARAQNRLVFAVVKDATVRTTADDRQIARLGARPAEFVFDLRLDLVFVHPRPTTAHGSHVRTRRNPRRLAHQIDFGATFEEAHLV